MEQILSHKESGILYLGKVSWSRFCKPLGPKRPLGDAQHLEGLKSVLNSLDVDHTGRQGGGCQRWKTWCYDSNL